MVDAPKKRSDLGVQSIILSIVCLGVVFIAMLTFGWRRQENPGAPFTVWHQIGLWGLQITPILGLLGGLAMGVVRTLQFQGRWWIGLVAIGVNLASMGSVFLLVSYGLPIYRCLRCLL